MFDSLSQTFSNLVSKFKGKGQLSKKDLDKALKSTQNLLIQSDVALPVVHRLISRVKNAAASHASYVSPSEALTTILKNEIETILKQKEYSEEPIFPDSQKELRSCLLIGLQGSGKTTTSGKLARRMISISQKPAIASFDFSRAAAQAQLSKLAAKLAVPFFPVDANKSMEKNVKDMIQFANQKQVNVLLVDTAGTKQTQNMREIHQLKEILQPSETILVIDSMTGQESLNVAKEFHEKLFLTGVILSKTDGDTKGGAALSIAYITKLPIKYIGTGERLEDLQIFHFKRIIQQILKRGDLETLKETLGESDSHSSTKPSALVKVDMNTIRNQLDRIHRMGGMKKILKMMPEKMLEKANLPDENLVTQSRSAIDSMTPEERLNPKIINSSRKRRIAKGSGTSVVLINRLLKQYKSTKLLSKIKGPKTED